MKKSELRNIIKEVIEEQVPDPFAGSSAAWGGVSPIMCDAFFQGMSGNHYICCPEGYKFFGSTQLEGGQYSPPPASKVATDEGGMYKIPECVPHEKPDVNPFQFDVFGNFSGYTDSETNPWGDPVSPISFSPDPDNDKNGKI